MKIDYVEIKNFCQHKERTETLGAGVVGILGRNGKGKSNFVRAIRRGLTGSSGNKGTKDDDLSWGETDGFIKVGFSVGSTEGFIKRALNTARCNMQFGDKKLKTATEIDSVLYDILGVPPSMLSQMVFVEQGAIEGVLFQGPADRKASFQTLFGTEQAEKLRAVIAAEADTIIISSRADVIARTQKQLNDEVMPQIMALQSELAQYDMSGAILRPEDADAANATVALYEKNSQTDAQLTEARRQSDELTAQLSINSKQLAGSQSAVTEMQGMHDSLLGQVESARQQITAAGRAQQIMQQRQQIEQRLQRAAAIKVEPKPVEPVLETPLVSMRADLAECLQRRQRLRMEIEAGSGKTCPTCKQVVKVGGDPAELAAKQLECTALDHDIDQWNKTIPVVEMKLSAYVNDLARWTQRQTQAQDTDAQAHAELAALPADAAPLSPEQHKALTELLVLFDSEVIPGLRNAQMQLNSTQAVYNQTQERLQHVTARVNELSASLGQTVTLTEYQTAKTRLALHADTRTKAASANGRLQAFHSQRQSLETQIEQYKTEEAHMEGLKRWKEQLDRARALLHRDQLPNLVAQEFIKVLNTRLAFYLQTFEVPFLAQIQEDLSVLCTFSGNHTMMAERLSGGQKVMLGIAFRFAVYDMFVSNLGMLILDEPTVFLDDGNIDHVYNLLLKVRSYSKSAGLQLIVVTHEKRLMNIFDKVIEL